jgi:spermidine/putrescine transport system ATP-binding protein
MPSAATAQADTDGALDAVALEGVSRVYGSDSASVVRAVDNVSLAIRANEFFTLLGPSGCGKTTLLRLIAGFDHTTSGRVLLNGRDVGGLPPFRRPVNTVFQSYALFPHMTVADNVGFGLKMQGRPAAEIAARVAEMLQLVRMEALANRATSQISGGQQQRVALARALAPNPEVLLLDEPLSALDLKLRKAMQIELKRLQRDTGITFVFVTHDQEEALTMSDRIAVMSHGTVRQVGTPREIYDHPAERFVADFIGDANMLKGELIRVDGATGVVRLAAGLEVPARVPSGAPRSGPVTVVVRPEHAGLTRDPAASGIEVVVENAVYVGTDTQYHLAAADSTRLVVRSQNTRADIGAYEAGARLKVLIGDHAVQVLRD